jgi:hypothetical protein
MPSPTRHHQRLTASGLAAALTAIAISACGAATVGAPPKTVRVADFAAASVNPVTVSPLPGTADASPSTQISFLGGPGTTVSDVQVVGSSSGHHSGRLEAYSTGSGESFIPAQPFLSGERVSVSAHVAAGAVSAATVRTSFTVAFQAPVPQAEFPINPGSAADIQHYLSAPTITPSTVRITTPAGNGATPGDFFLAPYQGMGTPGEMIVDQAGSLIWFHAVPASDVPTNFDPQEYEGQTVLTWWQGRVLKLGFGQGEDEIYSSTYQPIARVRAGNGYEADLHQFTLTPQGTAWIDEFDPVEMNLTSMGGSAHAVVNDSIVQEIDVKTGLVMWEWHAFGHIPLRDSYAPMPHTSLNWDYVHVNSIDPGTNGDVLLSARNTWTIYDVNIHTGAFIWRIGGKYPSFKRASGTFFYWQHDARWQPGGLVSVFDNGSSPAEEKQSRGLLLDPNTASHTVTLVKQFTNPDATLLASSQGDLLNLPGGNWLMGYGGLPNFTEYTSSGQVLLDATLGLHVQDFRTFLAPWSGQPNTTPSIAAQTAGAGQLSVEASWNGATTVASWQVLAGPSSGSLTPVTSAPKKGFETTIAVHTSQPYVAVAALDSSGKTLATSAAISPGS